MTEERHLVDAQVLSSFGLESLCVPSDGNARSATTVQLSAYSAVALGEGRGNAALQGILDCLAMAGSQELYGFGSHHVCRTNGCEGSAET